MKLHLIGGKLSYFVKKVVIEHLAIGRYIVIT